MSREMLNLVKRYTEPMGKRALAPAEPLPELPEPDRVLAWRTEQLCRLVPSLCSSPELAEAIALELDWHELQRLVDDGCDPRVALRILV